MDEGASYRVWNLVTLAIARGCEEFVASLLFDLGTTGIVTLEESAQHLKLGAYFDQAADTALISATVEAEFARMGRAPELLGVSISALPDQDWMEKWKEGFEPSMVGERLIIAPSWRLPAGDTEGRLVIQIDPGMAFGTGTHETTRLCLELIERYWHGDSLLDVGTGTGILAIAGALLQSQSRVVAIDVDPLAVEVARENIVINKVTGLVEVLEGQPNDFVGVGFDVVIANLTAEVISNLITQLAGCLKPGGVLILSGILTELRGDVERSVEEAGLNLVERCGAGEWSAIVARSR